MVDTVVDFNSNPRKIGLVVRGKLAPDHHPDVLAQHADAILADGSPIGFYGQGNNQSGNAIGMSMHGVVYDYNAMRKYRPWYVDVDSAVANRVVSSVLLIDVDQGTADTFTRAWTEITLSPGSFNILGGNCSTHAAIAYKVAGVTKGGIPGLDTPDHLYQQLVDDVQATKLHSYSGFVGFKPASRGGYQLIIKLYTWSPQVAAPHPSRGGSLSGSIGSSA